MSVTTKRSTRITFLGCCNLPQQKALALRDSLQAIITHLSDIHAACDDARMEVHEKHKTIKDLTLLAKEVDVLLAMGKDQLALCESEQDIHQQLQKVYDKIKDNAAKSHAIFGRIGGDSLHKGIEKDAAQLVDCLLSLVRDTVELLKIADKFTIRRAETTTNDLYVLGQDLTKVTKTQLEEDLADPYNKTAIWVEKVIAQRADTIDEPNVKSAMLKATRAVAEHAPALLAAVRANNSREADRHLNGLHTATQEILRALGNAPEFAVVFDVDYIDTELAAKLAALAASVRAADPINVAKYSKAVTSEVEKRVKPAVVADPEKAKKATDACGVVLKAANHALTTRTETKSPVSPPYVAAENQLNQASNALLHAVHALPNNPHKKSPTHLIAAAQELNAKLHQLFIS